jgi:hypothetical protein
MATRTSQFDLRTMQETHLKCRTIGHAWDDYDADESNPRLVVQILCCLRCGALKKTKIITVGKLKGHYDGKPYTRHADGYLNKGAGRPMNAADRARMRIYRYQQQRNLA